MTKRYEKKGNKVTTVASMICEDGLVMGSDTKVVAGGMKWSESKIDIVDFGKSKLIIGGAGRLRHIKDAISWMELDNLSEILGKDYTFDNFLDNVVENAMPEFVEDYKKKYGENPEIEMLIGCVDENKEPHLIEIYDDGDYERVETCSAIGSGSIFGEILLRKLYNANIKVDFAKRLIGYMIWEIQEIDNDSGENMQIVCLSNKGAILETPTIEIEAYKHLPKLVHESYDVLRRLVQNIDLKNIQNAISDLNKTIEKSTAKPST